MTTNTNAALAQLRHLYANMMGGEVRDTAQTKRMAQGLLAPAIEALEQAALTTAAAVPPEGWVMVPVEPTLDMLDQGHNQIDFDRCDQRTDVLVDSSHTGELGVGTTIEQDMRDCWAAMLAAAPKAEPVPAGEYPPLPEWSKMDNLGELVPSEIRQELRAYVDADRAMRAQAAPAAVKGPSDDEIEELISEFGSYVAVGESSKRVIHDYHVDELIRAVLSRWGAVPAAQAAPQPAVQQGAVAWGIFGSKGFYKAAHYQEQAERFCAHYNKRKGDDPLKPYTARPLYTHPAAPVAQKEPTAWAIYDIKYGGSKSLHWNEQHNPEGDKQRFRAVPLYEASVAQGDAEDAARLEFAMQHGMPMERDGQYRYHGFAALGWHTTKIAAIDAARSQAKEGA